MKYFIQFLLFTSFLQSSTNAHDQLSPIEAFDTESVIWSRKKKDMVNEVTQKLHEFEIAIEQELFELKNLAASIETQAKSFWNQLSPKLNNTEDEFGELYQLFYDDKNEELALRLNPEIQKANIILTIFSESEFNYMSDSSMAELATKKFLNLGDSIITAICGVDSEICHKMKRYKFKKGQTFADRTYRNFYDLFTAEMNALESEGQNSKEYQGYEELIENFADTVDTEGDKIIPLIETIYEDLDHISRNTPGILKVVNPLQ